MDIAYSKKKIDFLWMGAATWTLQIDNELKLASDPCLCDQGTVQDYGFFKAKRLVAACCCKEDFDNVDLWLISHNHEDHLDEAGAKSITPLAEVVTHENTLKKLQHISREKLHVLKWHQSRQFQLNGFTIEVTAIPAIHGSNFISAYFAGGVNGYWIKISKEQFSLTLYMTGDTVNHPTVTKAVEGKKPDILIANIGGVNKDVFGGPLTFTNKALLDFSILVQPALILPIHFDTFSHYKDSIEELQAKEQHIVIPKAGEALELSTLL